MLNPLTSLLPQNKNENGEKLSIDLVHGCFRFSLSKELLLEFNLHTDNSKIVQHTHTQRKRERERERETIPIEIVF